jgi:rare lipoprotein A
MHFCMAAMQTDAPIFAPFGPFNVAFRVTGKVVMLKMKKLCVYGVAAMALGVPMEAALAQCGTASWYHEGARTANGERYRPDGISAAHRSLPFGTRVQVRNQRTGRTVTVRINDRGPFIGGRIIDLSRGAKRVLGMDGLAPVCIAVLGRGTSVASADDNGRAVTTRRRVRVASVAGEVKTSVRKRSRIASLRSKKRIASLSRRQRLAALERRERKWASRQRRNEVRLIERRNRVSQRNEARAERFGYTEM